MVSENKNVNWIIERFATFLYFIKDRFDLHEGKEDEMDNIEYVKKNVEFRTNDISVTNRFKYLLSPSSDVIWQSISTGQFDIQKPRG
jgi:hypothetical protein